MKSAIQWAVKNSPAMNTLMIVVLLVGALSMTLMRREVFPEFDLEIILVTVPYPGASPAEVEEGICQKIEEAVQSVSGIKKITGVAAEGTGNVVIEADADVDDVQRLLNEIRSEVDRIPSFPGLAEDPIVRQITLRDAAIRVGVVGPPSDDVDAELTLRTIAEGVREQLLMLPSVSQVNLVGAREYQIDVEVSEHVLRKHGLTLQQVAQIIRRENIELPGGTIRTPSQEILLRGKNKRLTGEEIAEIPLVTHPGGVVLSVGDLGEVRDEFTDVASINEVDGQPAVILSIDRTSKEDMLLMVDAVRERVAQLSADGLPYGYELRVWMDRSIDVRDRMELLTRNGLQGLVLVFVVLAIFLDLRLAFWVALGIPIAVLGAGIVLWMTGNTLNMLSMFAFLMALGIVVDDAIVIGENIHTHRQRGEAPLAAAVNGAYEVLPAVTASVCTTIIAFAPLFYVSGIMGKFIAVMPVAVVAMLVISLVESTFILPCHLGHADNLFLRILGIVLYPFRIVGDLFAFLNRHSHALLSKFVRQVYLPTLKIVVRFRILSFAIAIMVLLLTWTIIRAGVTPFILFPKLDSNWIHAKITYPEGTPVQVTDDATQRLEQSIRKLDAEIGSSGENILSLVQRSVGALAGPGPLGPDSRTSGSNVGAVEVELVDVANRNVTSETILARWREVAGSFDGAESVVFGIPEFGPGGRAIEFKLLAPARYWADLEAAVEDTKARLAKAKGVFDIRDDSRPGKWEYQLAVTEKGKSLGITASDLAETVRASYYGEEVMRLQRGRHEVKLMVRYPKEQRRDFEVFEDIRIRTDDGQERPLSELAEIKDERGYAEINRVNQLRSITITADVDADEGGNADEITKELDKEFMPQLIEKYPHVRVRWEGQKEQSQESMQSLFRGFLVAILAMFVLLTLAFRSYLQPFIILAIIPFGIVGAVWGHALLGLPLTIFTMFGVVALTGVVVNDSIVLIDFINHEVRRGTSLLDAIAESGVRRFRPVLLTSITTIAGLFPMLTERSFQAQILIPMAASMVFGLLLATVLVLYLIPVFYSFYVDIVGEASLEEKEL